MEKIRGRVWLVGDNIDTDVILPGPYLPITDPYQLAAHALEGLGIDFAARVQRGDVLVAGRNFGCGSSREQAPVALKYAGVGAVVAESFARIFYRNAISIGFPVLTCPGLRSAVREQEEMELDLAGGLAVQVEHGKVWQAERYPDFLLGIMADGGLVSHLQKRFKQQQS